MHRSGINFNILFRQSTGSGLTLRPHYQANEHQRLTQETRQRMQRLLTRCFRIPAPCVMLCCSLFGSASHDFTLRFWLARFTHVSLSPCTRFVNEFVGFRKLHVREQTTTRQRSRPSKPPSSLNLHAPFSYLAATVRAKAVRSHVYAKHRHAMSLLCQC
jgi:hypothetical protein